jgi:molybdate transport system substrate-binding protein
MSFRFLKAALVSAALVLGAPPAIAQEIVVIFAAASTTTAMDELMDLFEAANSGVDLRASYAASSILARQITSGAPAHIFLSASPQWMAYATERGTIDEASRFDLVSNQLVLVAAPGTQMDVTIGPGFPLVEALDGGRLAMGDPDHVPAGIYGREALESLGVWTATEPSVARTMDVRGALALVERGEAVAGIVYATDATLVGGLAVVGTFPADSHGAIVYPIAAVTGTETAASSAFLEFLKSDQAADVFARHGFDPIPGA